MGKNGVEEDFIGISYPANTTEIHSESKNDKHLYISTGAYVKSTGDCYFD